MVLWWIERYEYGFQVAKPGLSVSAIACPWNWVVDRHSSIEGLVVVVVSPVAWAMRLTNVLVGVVLCSA